MSGEELLHSHGGGGREKRGAEETSKTSPRRRRTRRRRKGRRRRPGGGFPSMKYLLRRRPITAPDGAEYREECRRCEAKRSSCFVVSHSS